jgi:hypothetical protein
MTDTSHLDIGYAQKLDETAPQTQRTVKQVFKAAQSLEDLKKEFVFYTPVCFYLATSKVAVRQTPTDMLSSMLALILDEHPIVITDLNNPIYTVQPGFLMEPEYKPFQRTLYAVPHDVWAKGDRFVKLCTAVDAASHLYTIFKTAVHTIPSPFHDTNTDATIDVQFLNCYSNKLIYYFVPQPDQKRPQLQCFPSVQELAAIADQILAAVDNTNKPLDTRIIDAAAESEQTGLVAMFNQPKNLEPIRPKINNSILTPSMKAEVHELIKLYYDTFGDPNNPQPQQNYGQ